MKKIRIIFAVLAILAASAGVFANAMFAEVWYRAASPSTLPGAHCDFTIPPQSCSGTATQCIKPIVVEVNGDPQTLNFLVSKTVDGGPCQVVQMN